MQVNYDEKFINILLLMLCYFVVSTGYVVKRMESL